MTTHRERAPGRRLGDTRFALDRLIEAAGPEVIDDLLDRWLSYPALVMRANPGRDVEWAFSTYLTLLAAKLRTEARRRA